MTKYLAKFWNRESGWLHSQKEVEHDSDNPDEIAKAAVEAVKEDSGEDVSGLRVSVSGEDGEGVPVPEDKPEPPKPEPVAEPEGKVHGSLDEENDRKEYEAWKAQHAKPTDVPVTESPDA